MHRVATWFAAAALGMLLLALVYTLGYVSNGGGTTIVARPDRVDGPAESSGAETEVDFDRLEEIVQILEDEYIDQGKIDEQALYEAAINGLLGTLADSGTFYVDPISYQVSIGPAGTFEGIGATVAQQGNEIVIVAPIRGSPAEDAGLQSGDAILAVNGESTVGWSVDKAVLQIRGPKGTEVTLTIRSRDGSTRDVTIVRDEIRVESVSTTPPGGVLRDAGGNETPEFVYVRIAEFTQRTPEELEPIISEAEETGKSGIILDVRGNPGGLLQETVDVADMFLDEGTILVEVDAEGGERVYASQPGGPALTIPIVILQDQFSASGAEVLAAALHDNERAVIVGKKSFGKGTVNIARELSDGGALFVTIARWLTPNGVQIDGVGISPDIEASPGPFDPQYDPQADAQILRAIEHLRSLQASEEPVPSSAAP